MRDKQVELQQGHASKAKDTFRVILETKMAKKIKLN
jgi:hypothetical protein